MNFKVQFELKQEAGHYHKVKFDWLQVEGDGTTISFPLTDTGFLKDWTLVQIEGEEPLPPEPEIPDPKAKKAQPPKKDAAKNKGVLEEITDNRPRIVTFEKDFSAEAGLGTLVTEEVAKCLSKAKLSIELYEVNRETQEESHCETIKIDISCLLFPTESVDVSLIFQFQLIS